MKRLLLGLSAIVILSGTASQLPAATIFSSFGLGDSYFPGGYVVDGTSDIAMRFSVSGGSDYTFTSVELVLFDRPGALDILLMSDSAGLPGSVIETLTITDPSGIVSAASALSPTLFAGTTYWIATQFVGDYSGAWNWTDPLQTGPFAYTTDGGASWIAGVDLLSVFRVNGVATSAVPEPGSLTLAAFGLFSFVSIAWIRRRSAA